MCPASFLVKSRAVAVLAALPYTDNFNRADSSTLGTTSDGKATWINNGATIFGVINNQAYMSTASPAGGFTVLETGTQNVDMSVLIAALPSAGSSGALVARYVNAQNYIHVGYFDNGAMSVYRFDNNNLTSLVAQTASGVLAAGDTLRVLIDGTVLKIYKNSTLLYTVNNLIASQVTATKHGLAGDSNPVTSALRLDNFSIAHPPGPITFSDDFNRSDRNLHNDNGWVGRNTASQSSFSIVNNQMRLTTSAPNNGFPGGSSGHGVTLMHEVYSSNPDIFEIEFDWSYLESSEAHVVLVSDNPSDTSKAIVMRFTGTAANSILLYTYSGAGNAFYIANPTSPDPTGLHRHKMRLVRSTGVLTLFQDGVQYHSQSNLLGYTGDYAGLGGTVAQNNYWDNFNAPSSLFTDDFNRANEAFTNPNSWNNYHGQWALVSNQARPTVLGSAPVIAVVTRPGGGSPGFALDYAADVSTNVWLVIRHDPTSGEFILIRGDLVFGYSPGTGFSQIATLTGTNADGRLRVVIASGSSTATVTQNGTSIGTFGTTGSAAKNRVGFYTADNLAGKFADNVTLIY